MNTFKDFYYGEMMPFDSEGTRPLRPDEIQIANVLNESSPGARERVEQAYQQWKRALHDVLRDEMRYKLSHKEVQRSVPVKIVDGFPKRFGEVMGPISGWLFALLRKRRHVLGGAKVLEIARKNRTAIENWLKNGIQCVDSIPTEKTLKEVEEFLRALDAELKTVAPPGWFCDINEDLLGAYFFRIPKIELYWMPITIVATSQNLSIEGLTVTVAAHELAHAYTHLGFSCDGKDWDTERFEIADLHIVEGLAQFYTAVVTDRLRKKSEEPWEAYSGFLNLQGGPYRAHLEWGDDRNQIRESVRSSMNELRATRDFNHESFKAQIEHYTDILNIPAPISPGDIDCDPKSIPITDI
jgi:hypothetical protein